jgi:hypothetical protein
MGIFSSIKNAIFGRKKEAPQPEVAAAPVPAADAQPQPQPTAPQPAPEPVDVEAILNGLAAERGGDLNWRTSIVDLMKLVGMESSYAERKELAQELGYTGEYDGSADDNIWLHKRVLQELAKNGGMVPANLLD